MSQLFANRPTVSNLVASWDAHATYDDQPLEETALMRSPTYDLLVSDELPAMHVAAARTTHVEVEQHHETVLNTERRSAYEIVFILLAGAVAVLLAAPPLVQVLLAARGIQS